MSGTSRSAAEAKQAPRADAEDKPDSPTDLTKRSWKYIFSRTLREFTRDQCTDIAAALTYFAVLALFPALIALLSIIGLMGDSQEVVATLLDILNNAGGSAMADTLEPVLTEIATSQAAGLALALGLATALWSASGYTSAFARAMNRMYEVEEGRMFVKFRGTMLAVTAALLVMAVVVVAAIALSGPAAEAVGDAMGLGGTAVTVWNIAKWPVILAVVVIMVALLYWAAPNLKQPKFRWLSVGAAVAIVVWALASAGFGLYVANFSNYNQTYGALAGVIIFLLWLWITNLALLFGAELDAELERGRELQAGIVAEEKIQLPPRDTKKIEKNEEKDRDNIRKGREIRHAHAEDTPSSKE